MLKWEGLPIITNKFYLYPWVVNIFQHYQKAALIHIYYAD